MRFIILEYITIILSQRKLNILRTINSIIIYHKYKVSCCDYDNHIIRQFIKLHIMHTAVLYILKRPIWANHKKLSINYNILYVSIIIHM